MANIVYALFSTWVTPTVQLERGQVWDAGDPVVRSHPDWFTDDPAKLEAEGLIRRSGPQVHTPEPPPVVEQATRAPGEKRNPKRG